MTKADDSGSGCVPAMLAALACVLFVGVWAKYSFIAAVLVAGGVLVVTVVISVAEGRKREARNQARRAAEYEQHLAYLAAKEAERQARYASLCHRFGQSAADGIFAGQYWQGATLEMMHESLGVPADVREKVFKSKTKTTYCYRPIDARRYELKVHFEDGIVVGWDD